MARINATLGEQEALDMLAECFMEAPGSLDASRSRDSIGGWDSMGALLLIAELDERFGLELTADASRAMSSVADAMSFMRRHGVLSP